MMRYEVVADLASSSDWRAEAINEEGDGEVYVAMFTGPEAEARAREYADWKNTA